MSDQPKVSHPEANITLYHGTTLDLARRIAAEGLRAPGPADMAAALAELEAGTGWHRGRPATATHRSISCGQRRRRCASAPGGKRPPTTPATVPSSSIRDHASDHGDHGAGAITSPALLGGA